MFLWVKNMKSFAKEKLVTKEIEWKEAYTEKTEYLKEQKSNPKFIGIYDSIIFDANNKFGLKEKSNTLKKAFSHSRIKREILKLKRLEKKK